MAGRKGRSGGQNKLPATLHILRGTHRADRHAPIAGANALAAEAAPVSEWRPSRSDLSGLGPAGRRLISRIHSDYVLDLADGLLVVEAAQAADELARLRAIDRDALTGQAAAGHDRRLRQWAKHYSWLVRELRLSLERP